jgi:hypothetical protein
MAKAAAKSSGSRKRIQLSFCSLAGTSALGTSRRTIGTSRLLLAMA